MEHYVNTLTWAPTPRQTASPGLSRLAPFLDTPRKSQGHLASIKLKTPVMSQLDYHWGKRLIIEISQILSKVDQLEYL